MPTDVKKETEAQNIIRMGRKPFSNYLMALNAILIKGAKTISIRGRGKLTSRVIDLAEFGKRVHGLKCPIDPEHWKVSTEELESRTEQGRKTFVTSMEIILDRP